MDSNTKVPQDVAGVSRLREEIAQLEKEQKRLASKNFRNLGFGCLSAFLLSVSIAVFWLIPQPISLIGEALLIAAGAAGLAMVLILVGKNRKSMEDVKKENERFRELLP